MDSHSHGIRSSSKIRKNIASGSVITKQHHTYEPTDAGTKFTIAYDVKVGGLLMPFTPIMVCAMRKALGEALGNLKAVLETRA